MKKMIIFMLSVLMLADVTGCAKKVNMQPKTAEEWRTYLRYRRDEVLRELYKAQPKARSEIARAKGYAVFTNLNVNLLLASFAGGRGIVHENGLFGKDTFMCMGQGGV